MKFKDFQSVCKYMEYGCDECCGANFHETCRRKDMIPDGKSWGICDENHCPYFPKKINNFVGFDNNGKVLLRLKEATIQ